MDAAPPCGAVKHALAKHGRDVRDSVETCTGIGHYDLLQHHLEKLDEGILLVVSDRAR